MRSEGLRGDELEGDALPEAMPVIPPCRLHCYDCHPSQHDVRFSLHSSIMSTHRDSLVLEYRSCRPSATECCWAPS